MPRIHELPTPPKKDSTWVGLVKLTSVVLFLTALTSGAVGLGYNLFKWITSYGCS